MLISIANSQIEKYICKTWTSYTDYVKKPN